MRRLAFGLVLLALPAYAQQSAGRIFPVFFTPMSSELDQAGRNIVRGAATFALRHPSAPIRVVGYADPAGAGDDLIKLSKDRANAVVAMLIEDGVTPHQITLTAAGNPSKTLAGLISRRVEIDVAAR